MAYNVTAVIQTDSTTRFGPAYLLNGLNDVGCWYQVGLSYNWDGPTSYNGYNYTAGFNAVYAVFRANGTEVLPPPPYRQGYAVLIPVAVNQGDSVLLSLSFSGGNVVMHVYDRNTRSSSSQTYSAEGGSRFVGNSSVWSSSEGFFTGLMTEWYHPFPFYGNESAVAYTNYGSVKTSAWMWMDEFNANNSEVLFQAATPSLIQYTNPDQQQFLSSLGATEYSDAFEFVTGSLVTGVITPTAPSIASGQSVTLTANPSGGTGPYSYQWYTSSDCSTGLIYGATSSTYSASPMSTTTYYYGVTDNNSPAVSACSSGDTVTVGPLSRSILTLLCSPASVAIGSATTCKATVKGSGPSPTGTVTWTQGGTGSVSFSATKCTLSTGSCSLTMTGSKLGSATITGTYSGDTSNQDSSGTAKLTIAKASIHVTMSCTKSSFKKGTKITCTATVTGTYPSHTGTITWSKTSGKGSVTFSSKTCTLKAGKCSVTVTGTVRGGVTIKATYGGDLNNLGSSGTIVRTIA